MDGGILYKTNAEIEELNKIRFFNNSFLVLSIFENLKSENPIENMIEKLLQLENFKLGYKKKNAKTFRIFSSVENSLISVDKKLLGKLESQIIKETKLRVEFDKRPANVEFWLLYRTEKIGFFMMRITENKKKLEKGELRPELANIMCLLSEPNESDIILDPFCGSGAILLERSRTANFKGIFACDKNSELIQNLKNYIKKLNNKKLNKSFFIKNLDFFSNNFENDFFTSIITDPPWGFYEELENSKDFYNKMFVEMSRILKDRGIIVLLTANKDIISELFKAQFSNLKLVENYDILVSGKKAGLYKFVKIHRQI